MRVVVATRTVRGQEFTIKVSDVNGKFSADNSDGEKVAGEVDTMPEVIRELNKATREQSASVEVPFTLISRHNLSASPGVATGIHAGNRNVLVRWADGTKDQLRSYNSGTLLSGTTDDERDEWKRLAADLQRAYDELNKFEGDRSVNLMAEVRKAIAGES